MSGFWTCHECGAEMYGFENCQFCGAHKGGEAKSETNWERLFGTPERAARTLTHVCQFTHGGEMCDRCRLYVFNECDGVLRLMTEQTIYDALLEWMRGDA